jgi:predicted ATP-grasp superfamily ATP-dependent carboligase
MMAWVVKPDDGAGCEDTRLFYDANIALEWIDAQRGNFVLTPFVAGTALSLSMLCRERDCSVLACNRQRVLLRDDRFCFLGTSVGAAPTRPEFTGLARKVAKALPGLWGHVGIDFVWDGRRAVLMDVNPRLTTSWVGLHEALGVNPAALVLDLLDPGRPLPPHFEPPHAVDVDLEAGDGQ